MGGRPASPRARGTRGSLRTGPDGCIAGAWSLGCSCSTSMPRRTVDLCLPDSLSLSGKRTSTSRRATSFSRAPRAAPRASPLAFALAVRARRRSRPRPAPVAVCRPRRRQRRHDERAASAAPSPRAGARRRWSTARCTAGASAARRTSGSSAPSWARPRASRRAASTPTRPFAERPKSPIPVPAGGGRYVEREAPERELLLQPLDATPPAAARPPRAAAEAPDARLGLVERPGTRARRRGPAPSPSRSRVQQPTVGKA
mmetsp:Transcript_27689/g.94259  ORF Transcript_27689/g.94259 Transcript_27689/m.94259 type:complete len:258 (-) Transcript_27689:228-1001(-)